MILAIVSLSYARYERKPTEQHLTKLNAALQSANDAVVIIDYANAQAGPLIEYVNPAFLQMFGYKMADVIGKSPDLLRSCDGRCSVVDELRREFQGHKASGGKWSIIAAPEPSSWRSGTLRGTRTTLTRPAIGSLSSVT